MMVLSSCDQDMMHGVVSPVVGVGLLYRLQYTGESDTSRPAYVGTVSLRVLPCANVTRSHGVRLS